jgi:glycerol-3-phosphate cytidylyltransferase
MIFNHIKQLKADGKKIGITFSTFDMLHAGHIAMLSEAKNHCDYLICGLQTDPTIDRPDTKNHPIQSVVERQIQLSACRYVDEFTGKWEGHDRGIQHVFNSRDHSFSSSSLRKRVAHAETLKAVSQQ